MNINDELIAEIEELSKIRLSEDEKSKVKAELGEILAYIDVLNELDTDGVEAVSHTVGVYENMRDDVVQPSLSSDEITANAPGREGSFFSVPKAFE